eukprot:scaffold195_cov161-Skeletonema_menzelii.AAC.3
MNIILKILLLSSAVVTKTHANEEETNNNNLNLLRGGGGGEERALSDDCVSRSTYLGCFNDRNQNRAMSTEIEGRGYTARECESACAERGFLYFGRQWRGQCFCSNSDYSYKKHGTASNCDCCGTNVGSNKMCVYELQTAEATYAAAPGCTDRFNGAPYLGCYEDRNRKRALPHEVHGKFHSAEFCQMECKEAGYRYFARQWRGQCFCGDYDYNKYGPASNCDCCGRNVGANKMCVWDNGGGVGSGETAGTPPTEPVTTATTTDAPVTTTDAPEKTTDATQATETVSTTAGYDYSNKNIVDIAVEAGIFNTLVAAVEAADLVDALTAEGPLTVLAPNDEAFDKLPEGTVDQLLLSENVEILKEILLLHVIEGKVDSSMVSSGPVTTLSGNLIQADVSDSGISFNDANVIAADILASNGVVHAIDQVLLPPDVSL